MMISFFNGTDFAVDTLGDAFFTYNGTDSDGAEFVCSGDGTRLIFVAGDATGINRTFSLFVGYFSFLSGASSDDVSYT